MDLKLNVGPGVGLFYRLRNVNMDKLGPQRISIKCSHASQPPLLV